MERTGHRTLPGSDVDDAAGGGWGRPHPAAGCDTPLLRTRCRIERDAKVIRIPHVDRIAGHGGGAAGEVAKRKASQLFSGTGIERVDGTVGGIDAAEINDVGDPG